MLSRPDGFPLFFFRNISCFRPILPPSKTYFLRGLRAPTRCTLVGAPEAARLEPCAARALSEARPLVGAHTEQTDPPPDKGCKEALRRGGGKPRRTRTAPPLSGPWGVLPPFSNPFLSPRRGWFLPTMGRSLPDGGQPWGGQETMAGLDIRLPHPTEVRCVPAMSSALNAPLPSVNMPHRALDFPWKSQSAPGPANGELTFCALPFPPSIMP